MLGIWDVKQNKIKNVNEQKIAYPMIINTIFNIIQMYTLIFWHCVGCSIPNINNDWISTRGWYPDSIPTAVVGGFVSRVPGKKETPNDTLNKHVKSKLLIFQSIQMVSTLLISVYNDFKCYFDHNKLPAKLWPLYHHFGNNKHGIEILIEYIDHDINITRCSCPSTLAEEQN